MRPTTVTLVGAGFERVFRVTEFNWTNINTIKLQLENAKTVAITCGICTIIIELDNA